MTYEHLGPVIDRGINPDREYDPHMAALRHVTAALQHYANRRAAMDSAIKAASVATNQLEYRPITIRQSRGATLKFQGKLLCETEFDTRNADPISIALQLWETPTGTWIATSRSEAGDGHTELFATVVDPDVDQVDRQCSVMAAWDWHHTARKMVRQQLGWRFVKEIS